MEVAGADLERRENGIGAGAAGVSATNWWGDVLQFLSPTTPDKRTATFFHLPCHIEISILYNCVRGLNSIASLGVRRRQGRMGFGLSRIVLLLLKYDHFLIPLLHRI